MTNAKVDTREQLEADIRKCITYVERTLMYPDSANKTTEVLRTTVESVIGWLDRQAAITEREIESTHIKLPLDADGVPIHIGDNVRLNPKGGIFTVRGVGVNTAGNPVMWGVRESNTQTTRHRIDGEIHHVQPDTVESLLEDLVEVHTYKTESCTADVIAEYAERIRKAVE